MASAMMFVLSGGVAGAVVGAARGSARCPAQAPRATRRHAVVVSMAGGPTSWEEYVRARNAGQVKGGTIEEATKQLETFIAGGGDMEFDGGDSGGGVVGDGNTDLEDQHNSPNVVRGGFGQAQVTGNEQVGRGKVVSAMEARVASTKGNYFGRSTGYAEQKIAEISEEDRRLNRLDEVRAQQLENWHNQRSIHQMNQAQGQGVMYGAPEPYSPPASMYQSQEIPGQRLDGETWKPLVINPSDPVEKTFDLSARVDSSEVVELSIRNAFCTFLPFRCVFTPDSSPFFTATPEYGTMDRSDGDPTDIIVRFTPRQLGSCQATLVFETEDFKYIYKFNGAT
ncbi:hypothetical protein FVE85_3889 [Porphyridium purpureum]|uniref:MSP domain-containing protein n=1 Tax=Porphyridium purpureum TaxID=35688 RepID=A0A5J4YT29_PORPP|nr:hypothetical protein FVE85_3889 [Porphyridium purpureum]|eukprot:POR9180..scf229_5